MSFEARIAQARQGAHNFKEGFKANLGVITFVPRAMAALGFLSGYVRIRGDSFRGFVDPSTPHTHNEVPLKAGDKVGFWLDRTEAAVMVEHTTPDRNGKTSIRVDVGGTFYETEEGFALQSPQTTRNVRNSTHNVTNADLLPGGPLVVSHSDDIPRGATREIQSPKQGSGRKYSWTRSANRGDRYVPNSTRQRRGK